MPDDPWKPAPDPFDPQRHDAQQTAFEAYERQLAARPLWQKVWDAINDFAELHRIAAYVIAGCVVIFLSALGIAWATH
jgi:hypothetical protein